jgi:glycosyltransferase involved in cell wall biosynthesis
VVIPLRGPQPWLGAALASLAGEGAAEIIVVEDGSSWADPALLPAGTRLLRFSPVGRSQARNAGVVAARTPYVAFLDADDIALTGRLARQVAALEAAPAAALCFGGVEAIDAAGAIIPGENATEHARFAALRARGASYESLLMDCPIYTSATLVRRDLFLAAGGYDARHDAYEDLDLYLRLARTHGLVDTPGGPVSQHRRHGANTPSPWLYAGALRVADRHLAAGRAAEPGQARQLLLERRVDSLWGLGDIRGARAAALAALRVEPRLLRHPRLRRRLAATLTPAGAIAVLRRLR